MKKLLLVLALVLIGLIAGSYALPGNFEVRRSVVIAAEPASIETHLTDLESWPEWSAWNKEVDPGVEFTFTGAAGEGQQWDWAGDALGQGKLRLRKVTPGKGIQYGISFKEPDMKGDGQVLIEPSGEAYEVTWISRGALGKNPVFRWMGLFMDGQLGPDLETSLAGLKERAEAGAAAPTPDTAADEGGEDADE